MDRVAYSPWGCKELDMTRCTLCLKKVQFYYISLGTSRSIYYMNDYLVLCSEQSITYKIFKVYLPSIWNNTLSSHSLNMQTLIQFSSVESLNRVRLFVTPLTARPPFPSPTPGACSIHVHQVGDTIQTSHPLSSPSPPTFNLSQHQGLFR